MSGDGGEIEVLVGFDEVMDAGIHGSISGST